MSFKRIAAICGIALLASSAVWSNPDGSADFRARGGVWLYNDKPFFSTSAHAIHHTFRKDRSQGIEDLKQLKAAGFTTVEVYWLWNTDMQLDGSWRFDDLDDFVLECKKLGIKNFCMFGETAPGFLSEKLGWSHDSEEGALQRRAGDLYVCNPSYVAESKKFYMALLDHLRMRPDVSENIVYWNMGGEYAPFRPNRQSKPLDYGYDSATVKAFRNWLVGKGYTPQSIAARWGASGNAYASWENVWPAINMSKTDFKGVALTNIGVARWDWYDFRQEASWKYMRNVVGWIRDAGENRPMVHEYNIVTPGGIAPFLRWNRVGAMPGFDGVHLASGSFEREFDYHAVLAYLAICKGASDPPWQSNELKGNMSPEWMTKHVWLLSALGGTGMVFWDWASEGWGVVNSDRKPTDSSAEALRLNREIGFYGDLLQGSKPMPNRVGILVLSEETYYSPYVHEREIMAVAKTLLEQGSGCEVATITDDEVLQKDISGYKVILVPSQEHMRQSVREKLAAFVKNGGTLWLTPGSASKSEADQVTPVNPGVPLNQVAGLSIGVEIPPVIATVAGGRGVAPLGMLSRSVTATTALPIRQMGNKPAIFRNRYGRGACYYQAAVTAYSPGKGTPILNDPEGLKSYIEINSGNLPSDLLSEALAGAGVAPYVKVFDGSGRLLSTVLVGVRKTNPGYLVFLIEAGNYTSNITVRLNSGRLGINGSWVAYAPKSLETKTVKSSSFTTLLKPSQVKIFHLVPKADSAKWIAAFKNKNWPAIAKTLPTVAEAKLVPPSEMGKVDPGDLRAIKPEPFGNKWLLVDISRHANRSLIEEGEKENAKSFIGSGGIGDNDLRALPVGMQEFLGIPFKILDSKVDKTTCMVTKSSSRPGLGPLEFKGIPIRDLVSKVHWLYGAGWAPFGLPIGYVTYHYADGTKAQENLICGKNILNWWGRNQSYESDKLRLAWAGSTPASTRNFQTVGLYHYAWENSSPQKMVESIDINSYGGDACIIVVAMTAER